MLSAPRSPGCGLRARHGARVLGAKPGQPLSCKAVVCRASPVSLCALDVRNRTRVTQPNTLGCNSQLNCNSRCSSTQLNSTTRGRW
eukprot:scaffold102915_cov63-Phaeocystis_antarctica.AAC.1